MKIYIAAPYAARAQVKVFAEDLWRMGYVVTSSWLDEAHEINAGTVGAATDVDDVQIDQHARDDMRDIDMSDLLIVLTESIAVLEGGTATSGGRHVETGYAIAKLGYRNVIVVGEPENVFHRLNGVIVCPTWHEAVVELAARLVTRERACAPELAR